MRHPKVPEEIILEVYNLKKQGISNTEIGKRYDHSSGWTQNVLNSGLRLGLIPKGEVHPKQTHKHGTGSVPTRRVRTLARQVYRMKEKGLRDPQIARKLNISSIRVYQLLSLGYEHGWFKRIKKTRRQLLISKFDPKFNEKILKLVDKSKSVADLLSNFTIQSHHYIHLFLNNNNLYDGLEKKKKLEKQQKLEKILKKIQEEYNTFVESLGYNPTGSDLAEKNNPLFRRINNKYKSLSRFRRIIGVSIKDVKRKNEAKSSLNIYINPLLSISKETLELIADGCPSVSEFSRRLNISHYSVKRGLKELGLEDEFLERFKKFREKSYINNSDKEKQLIQSLKEAEVVKSKVIVSKAVKKQINPSISRNQDISQVHIDQILFTLDKAKTFKEISNLSSFPLPRVHRILLYIGKHDKVGSLIYGEDIWNDKLLSFWINFPKGNLSSSWKKFHYKDVLDLYGSFENLQYAKSLLSK